MAAHDQHHRLFRAREAAEYLGISERTLWTLGNCGEIPTVRFGRSVRYDLGDLDAWIMARKRKGRADPPGPAPGHAVARDHPVR